MTNYSGDLVRNMLAVLFVAGMIAAGLWILSPFLPALIWATLLVVSTWPLMLAVQRRLWGKRSLAVIVMTLSLVLLVIAPLGLAVATIAERADEIGTSFKLLTLLRVPAPPAWAERVPVVGTKLAEKWKELAALSSDDLHGRVAPFAQDIARWILDRAGKLAMFFVHLLLTAIISTLFYFYGESAAAGVRAFAQRLAGEYGGRSVTLAAQAIKAVALGVVVTALIQAALSGIGLVVAGVPLATLLTALIFVLAVAQFGASLVLALAAGWLYWNGNATSAIALLVWMIVVNGMLSVIRPILIKQGANLPLVLIFAGVIGGLIAYGVVGLFVGPMVLAVAYRLLIDWVSDERRTDEASVA